MDLSTFLTRTYAHHIIKLGNPKKISTFLKTRKKIVIIPAGVMLMKTGSVILEPLKEDDSEGPPSIYTEYVHLHFYLYCNLLLSMYTQDISSTRSYRLFGNHSIRNRP